METIVRYKNGNLYSKNSRQWLTLNEIRHLNPTSFSVLESKTKKDITDEVKFLAEVDYVRRMELWNTARVIFE